MSVTPSPIGGFAAQFFDNNGVILSGGKIFTYAAGTTTPQATYTSASGATPHANPIILDSAGRVPGGEIWLTDGLVYKFVIETATGILLGTYDNITGVNSNFVNYTVQEEVITATAGQTVFNLSTINYTPGTNSLTVYIDGVNQYVGDSYLETDSNTVTFTSGVHVGGEVKFTTAIQTTSGAVNASIVAYDPPFTGAVSTNVENKLAQTVSVKDFGAVGNGVANDTAAINAALSASDSVFFPLGTYLTTGSHNITGKTLYGVSRDDCIIKLSGSNTNVSVFINGGSISTPWGSGGGCTLQNLKVEGNWDGATVNTETNISSIGGLFKWWSGTYIQIDNCRFTNAFGFGVFIYRLGYSSITACEIATTGMNGLHLEGPNGADAITSTSVNFCSIHSCRGRSTGAAIGGNAIYLKNGFSTSFFGNVVEDIEDGFRLDGNDNRSVSLFYLHSELAYNYDVIYVGSGQSFGMYQCILGSTNKFQQTNPQFQQYIASGNFGLQDLYPLPILESGANQVTINAATPQATIASITLTPGTWQITGAWNGTNATGTGTAATRQQFAIHNTAAIPAYTAFLDSAVSTFDSTSPVNTFTSGGILSFVKTVTTNTTMYLYGGPASISSSLVCSLAGSLKAVKINGPYY
jgi:hypothetical protein